MILKNAPTPTRPWKIQLDFRPSYHIPSYTIKGLEVFTSRRGHPCFCPAPLEVEITKQAFFVTPTTQVRD